MKGNTLGEFIDDILLTGGPEKEFIFRDKFFFLETVFNQGTKTLDLTIDEYDNADPNNKKYLKTYLFPGKNYADCVSQFETAAIFNGMTIYQAEQEIVVLFG